MIQERLISTPLMQFDHLFHESNNSLESFVCTSSCVFLEEEGGEWVIEKEMRRGGGGFPTFAETTFFALSGNMATKRDDGVGDLLSTSEKKIGLFVRIHWEERMNQISFTVLRKSKFN